MSTIDLQAKIPNNVALGDNRQLQRALEHWQPAFLRWWDEMGPSDFKAKDVYLRTAVGVDAQGWAQYGYTPMPDYRWGIFLADQQKDRKIGVGGFMGQGPRQGGRADLGQGGRRAEQKRRGAGGDEQAGGGTQHTGLGQGG